jgi:hypothetical protein
MARGFISTVIKISKSIDAANRKAQKEAERAQRERHRLQAKAEGESNAKSKELQRQYAQQLKERERAKSKKTKEAIAAEKAAFDSAILQSKEQYSRRCNERGLLVKKFIRKYIK